MADGIPQRLAFGAVADAYDAHRPGYPGALLDDLVARVGPGADVVDVGTGTGRVARALADLGLRGWGVEPDPGMAAVARRNLAGTGWQVEESDFETCTRPPDSADLLTCGQAWHWVEPDRGLARAVEVVRAGGLVALFWNRPEWDDGDPVRAELDALYERLEPSMVSSLAAAATPSKGRPLATDPPPAGFALAEVVEHRVRATYTSRAWVELLGTHSNHVQLPVERRTALHRAVGEVIDAHGGSMAITYRCEAWLGTVA